MAPIRSFIAAELPVAVQLAISGLQKQLADRDLDVRWTAAGNIHLTLKFLGLIDESRVENIAAVLAEAAHGFSPLLLAAKGVGVFPSPERARVIWVGVAGHLPELMALQSLLAKRLAAIGFPQEGRPFTGHLTLGRVKKKIAASRVRAALDAGRDFSSDSFMVDRVVLFKSELRPTGAVYTELHQAPLSGPAVNESLKPQV
ncbi:MAG: RNA 2',3'-cyclic phosphodiesterase [Desulfobacterales bacterium]